MDYETLKFGLCDVPCRRPDETTENKTPRTLKWVPGVGLVYADTHILLAGTFTAKGVSYCMDQPSIYDGIHYKQGERLLVTPEQVTSLGGIRSRRVQRLVRRSDDMLIDSHTKGVLLTELDIGWRRQVSNTPRVFEGRYYGPGDAIRFPPATAKQEGVLRLRWFVDVGLGDRDTDTIYKGTECGDGTLSYTFDRPARFRMVYLKPGTELRLKLPVRSMFGAQLISPKRVTQTLATQHLKWIAGVGLVDDDTGYIEQSRKIETEDGVVFRYTSGRVRVFQGSTIEPWRNLDLDNTNPEVKRVFLEDTSQPAVKPRLVRWVPRHGLIDVNTSELIPPTTQTPNLVTYVSDELRYDIGQERFLSQECAMELLSCDECKLPFHNSRPLARNGLCGDCATAHIIAPEVPAKPKPKSVHWEAWSTPSYDGEG